MNAKAWTCRLALGLSVLAAANQAFAAPAAPAAGAPDPGETSQYRAMLEEAVAEYDAHRYEEARALFRRAHEISPNARTLRGIGMASFELREYIEALRSLEASLVDQRRALTATQKTQVEALIERTRAFVGRFFLKLSPKETLVRVDGAPATIETDGSLLLSFGRHALTAEAPASISESREVNVIGGERQELKFALRPEPTPAVAAKTGAGGAGAGGARGSEAPASSGAAYWFAGAGALAAGAAGGFLWYSHQNSELNRCDQNNMDPNATLMCKNRGGILTNKNVALGVAIGSGVGALALGIVGTIVWSTNSKPESGTALACLPVPGAVNCELLLHF
jgi:tetratricopeptide (TPR) repeat protein